MSGELDILTNPQLADMMDSFVEGMKDELRPDMPHDEYSAALLMVEIMTRASKIVRTA